MTFDEVLNPPSRESELEEQIDDYKYLLSRILQVIERFEKDSDDVYNCYPCEQLYEIRKLIEDFGCEIYKII